MRRAVVILIALALACPAAAAAQEGGGAFGPLPPASTPAPEPVPVQDAGGEGDIGRTTLYLIAGGLIVLFIVIGRVITRDARRSLPAGARSDAPQLRDQGPHKHARRTKAKARARGRAQRAARRRNRP